MAAAPASDRAADRDRLAREIADYGTLMPASERREAAVLQAIRSVPRHRFVPEAHRKHAYADIALPIGEGQTISQPTVVAVMTDLLDLEPTDRGLEVGTGSGYQAAILAELVARVHSIEIIEPLARSAAARLKALGYANVEVRAGDGYAGWPEHAPFDAIIVTAGAETVPEPLIGQLKPGGRMVIPLGPADTTQGLILITKDRRGRTTQRPIIPVRFVPLTRKAPKGDQ